MAIYIIGDVQGCYDELQALLKHIKFDQTKDKLWFAGDLVNRGPKSLEVLRFVKSLGNSAITILGNHDLHLLAIYHGIRKDKRHTLDDVVKAADSEELMNWLRKRPLLHYDKKLNVCLVHAGLPPQWNLKLARSCANELEDTLSSKHYIKFLEVMYGDEPDKWKTDLHGNDRLRFICNSLTRMRYVTKKGKLALEMKGKPSDKPNKSQPWFEHPDRKTKDITIVFGHWSALGSYQAKGIFSTDTGCIWGGQLSALHIDADKPRYYKIDCKNN